MIVNFLSNWRKVWFRRPRARHGLPEWWGCRSTVFIGSKITNTWEITSFLTFEFNFEFANWFFGVFEEKNLVTGNFHGSLTDVQQNRHAFRDAKRRFLCLISSEKGWLEILRHWNTAGYSGTSLKMRSKSYESLIPRLTSGQCLKSKLMLRIF